MTLLQLLYLPWPNAKYIQEKTYLMAPFWLDVRYPTRKTELLIKRMIEWQ